MSKSRHIRLRIGKAFKSLANVVAGRAATALLALSHRCNRVAISNVGGAIMRTIGPWLPEHRTGRANLRAAFPEKTDAEIETILRGVWDNLGRVGAEIAHLDHICSGDRYKRTYIDYGPDNIERFLHVKEDGKPAVIFAAHLANWELPAVIAASDGLDTVVLYRRPNLGAVIALRRGFMGDLVPSSMGAPVTLARALEQGRHVAMLVDQHYGRGVEVTFFGRKCLANPLIAMLAREIECPIHGTRVIRLPGNRFAGEISPEVPPARDAEGRIDVAGTMQAITSVVESWVREHPEQWLWLHRRWR
jgi:Kdo2-lipid IVA lauroyltransferase/acyltransferase